MKNAASWGVTLGLLTGLLSFSALAQDLIIVRPGQEFTSHSLEPASKEKISRGRLVFHFKPRGTKRLAYDPDHTLIVYPHLYSKQPQPFTGKDAGGSLYFRGYPIVPAGAISVKIEPSDAEVFVNGHPVKIDNGGSSERVGYPIGQHKVEARKSGFKPYAGEVALRQASEVHLDIKLTP